MSYVMEFEERTNIREEDSLIEQEDFTMGKSRGSSFWYSFRVASLCVQETQSPMVVVGLSLVRGAQGTRTSVYDPGAWADWTGQLQHFMAD